MTAIKRLVSGSVAAWVQIGVAMSTQIALVPLYLSYWDKETYGVWLMIQAVIGLTTLFDMGHQNFLGNEFLKVGGRDRALTSKIFYSSLPIAFLIGLIELVIVAVAIATGAQQWLFGLDAAEHGGLLKQAGIVLIIQSAVWLIVGCCGGIAGRVLIPFGYYPRMAWWGVFASIVTSTVPAVAVVFGADLLVAGIVLGLTTLFYNIPLFADILRIMKRELLIPVSPDWMTGLDNFTKSILLTGKTFLEMARQQGVRLILSPIVGAADMAAFATMRTGANVALQSLGTVTNPLMPELMRFLNQKDQVRSEAVFGLVWLLVVLALGPAIIVLQWLAPLLFSLWTRGKIPFDPQLFTMLSLGVLIYALAQPAVAVVQCNNLLSSQLLLSAIAGGTVIAGLLLFVPSMGIRGAGIVLIAAEVISLIGYVVVASSWLKTNALRWPSRLFATVAASVAIAGIAMAGIAMCPREAEVIVVFSLTVELCVLVLYWRHLPQIARSRAADIVASSLPAGLGKRLASLIR